MSAYESFDCSHIIKCGIAVSKSQFVFIKAGLLNYLRLLYLSKLFFLHTDISVQKQHFLQIYNCKSEAFLHKKAAFLQLYNCKKAAFLCKEAAFLQKYNVVKNNYIIVKKLFFYVKK